jgi:hypothetical protein
MSMSDAQEPARVEGDSSLPSTSVEGAGVLPASFLDHLSSRFNLSATEAFDFLRHALRTYEPLCRHALSR